MHVLTTTYWPSYPIVTAPMPAVVRATERTRIASMCMGGCSLSAVAEGEGHGAEERQTRFEGRGTCFA